MQWYYFFPLGSWDSFIWSFCVTWPLRDAKIHFEAESRVWFLSKSFAQSEIKPFLSSHIVLKKLLLRNCVTVFHQLSLLIFSFFLYLHSVNFTSSCFSSKQNYSSLLCFFFVFGCCTLNIFCASQDLSFCCLDVMIWKTRCDPNRHIESYYIFDLSISMFCDISCPP